VANPLINIVGWDPSGSNWGQAAATYNVLTGELKLLSLAIVSPELDGSKAVRQSSKDIQRALALIEGVAPWAKVADVICAEVPSGSQNSRAALLAGICQGILGVYVSGSIPVIQVNANETRTVITGKPRATKREAIEWAMAKHPDANWPMITQKGETRVIEGKAEHMADAVAAIYASMKTDNFKLLVQARKGIM